METTFTASLAAAPIAKLHYVKMNSNTYITTDTYEFISRNDHQTYTMDRLIRKFGKTNRYCLKVVKSERRVGQKKTVSLKRGRSCSWNKAVVSP
ncbi:hypothetical protein T03_14662 [Trichinella britovi]|uniref:Uncharacterized protein n=1 Tax=Trichinella britovi TaxID=45882 RepID=A0A0V1CIR7_TRIBR|nr:hypothetical protein T03_14662 [Trichinella britovi]